MGAGPSGASPSPSGEPSSPTPRTPQTLVAFLNGTLPPGAYVQGQWGLVEHALHVLAIPNGTEEFSVELTADPTLGDLDFHLVTPEGRMYATDGHRGSAAAPETGRIVVPGGDATPGNWTIDVHSGEASPASGNTETPYSFRVEIRVEVA